MTIEPNNFFATPTDMADLMRRLKLYSGPECVAASMGAGMAWNLAAKVSNTRPPELWANYQDDFNSMSDDDIRQETQGAQQLIDESERWVEAVAMWTAAGRPRTSDKEERA